MTQILLTHLIIFCKKYYIHHEKKKNWAIKSGRYNIIFQQKEKI
jgi:hypothetical protein